MPKYWGKQMFTHGSFPEVGQKQKTEEKEERERERKKERLNNGNNNGQATHGARKHAWRTQAAWAKKLFKNGQLPWQLPSLVAYANHLYQFLGNNTYQLKNKIFIYIIYSF